MLNSRRRIPVLVELLVLAACGCGDGETTISKQEKLSSEQKAVQETAATNNSSGLSAGLSRPEEDVFRLEQMILFQDCAAEVGIDFVFDTGAVGKAYMFESTGGGGGWLDYDRDGMWDLYFCQGGDPKTEGDDHLADALYRQTSDGHFMRLPDAFHMAGKKYGQGVSVADFDEDGFDDVYISNVGPNILLHNLGDGTFEDVTLSSGTGEPHWGTSTAWADLDGDGDLDLYVCNYAVYDVNNPRICTEPDGRVTFCDPLELEAEPDVCFENLGDGTFRDVTKTWGFTGTDDRSLGVAILDLNDDNKPDVFVANDLSANFLYLNTGEKQFQEVGVVSGVAMSSTGSFQASMGVAAGDYNADGRADLYCTHYTNESNTLYSNLGDGQFDDITRFCGLHQPTWHNLGFGTVFQDFNFDGNMDLIVANGHIADWRYKGRPWKMPPQIFTFWNGKFYELRDQAGPYFQRKVLGRAIATCDYDRDADPDLLIVHQGEEPALLRNDSRRGHWLKLQFIGTTSNRRGIGTKVKIESTGADKFVRTAWLPAGTSYCAAHEPAIFLGLGSASGPWRLTVQWPSGIVQQLEDLSVDQSLTLTEPDHQSDLSPIP